MGQPERHDSSLCGNPDCRYRSLYEGTQTSLADMSAKQSSALRSLTALKRRVSDLVKQHFPNEHARAERSLVGRLADAEDEVLMTYLEDLVSSAISPLESPRRTAPLGADLLREALRMAGYPITDDDDLAAWAAAVSRHQARVDHARAQATGAPPGVVGSGGPGADWERLIDDTGPGTGSSGSVAAVGEDPFSVPAKPDGSTHAEFDDEGEPEGAGVDLDALFSGDGPGASERPGVGAPVRDLPDTRTVDSDLDDLFGDGPDGRVGAGAPDLDDLFGDGPAVPDDGNVSNGSPDLDDLFGDGPAVPDDGNVSSGAPAGAGPVSAEALTIPIRPELVATGRTKRTTRTPRRRADRPDPRRDLDDGDDAIAVEADVAVRIESAVAIPRPVFSSELVAVAGSQEVLDGWMQDMYDLGAQAPVRFVIAKTRHRFLGTLVLPDGALREAAVEFDNSWWAQVMSRYHGSALYELAVLLSRVGDQVQSSELSDTCAQFRLDTPRGLVGAVVHLGGGLEQGSVGRTELAAAIDGFRRERFTLMAVLNIHAGQPAMDALVSAVRETAEDARWTPAYPVIATNTWEWAANSGRTSTLVLGG